MSVVTRFAPSPTGFLHVGGARTALYCWLYARKMQGRFILRIEDTDVERSTKESVQAILDAMLWLSLDYDEGPYYQTERFPRYEEVAKQLLSEDKAYYCYCSKERLEALRNTQMENKEKPRYDGHCRQLLEKPTGSYVIRFKNPTDGVVEFHDLIRGTLTFNNSELDDLIIVRADGAPTYNFTVVVDDWDMKVTHVIRGDDHINNTPRQINILRALGATPPLYAHVPMILGPDGKRLSKRHGAASVMEYRDEGYLPESLLNYLVRLGWSHGDQEIFSREELINLFDIKDINKAAAALNPEKLLWLNHHYMKTSPIDHVASELAWHMQRIGLDVSHGPPLTEIVKAQVDRTKTLKEMAEKSRLFYMPIQYNNESVQKNITSDVIPILKLLLKKFSDLVDWTKEAIHDLLAKVAEEVNVKMGKIAQPLRVAVTGDTISPPIDITLVLLGRKETLDRLNSLLARYKE